MKKTAFVLMIITICSKLLGFGRELALSYVYGASAITDAYLISQTIPTVIFALISSGIATGFVPMYSRIFQEQGKLGANKYTYNLSNALLLFASIVVAFVLLFTQPIVKLFASGFTGETLALTVRFTRISVFGVYITALLGIFASYLRLNSNYILPALVGLPRNLLIIVFLFISARSNIYILVVGSALATALQLILLIPSLRKTGYRHRLKLNLKDEHIKAMIMIAMPVIIGTSVNEINILIDRALASNIAVGGISSLNYANRLNGFVRGLFIAPLTTVLYPMVAKMAAEKNFKGLKASIADAISFTNLLVIPAALGAMIFSKEIVMLLFGRGAFTSTAIKMTAGALLYYSPGMVAFGFRDILSRAFYALQDTKTPMTNATIAVVVNIVLNLILSRFLGIGGLALATSIAAIVSALLMFITLRKKIGGFGIREISRSFLKISLASIIMSCCALVGFNFLEHYLSSNLSLIIAIGVGALVYAILIFFLKIPEVQRTVEAIKKRIGMKIRKKTF